SDIWDRAGDAVADYFQNERSKPRGAFSWTDTVLSYMNLGQRRKNYNPGKPWYEVTSQYMNLDQVKKNYDAVQESKMKVDELTMSWKDYEAEVLKLQHLSPDTIKTILGNEEMAKALETRKKDVGDFVSSFSDSLFDGLSSLASSNRGGSQYLGDKVS